MKNFRIAVLILLIAIATPFALHRRAWALHKSTANHAAERISPLRIVSPAAGEELKQEQVVVKYAQIQAMQSNALNYELRLDDRDPVRTKYTNYTFEDLTPGKHNLVIQAVDANGAPVSGTRSEVQFSVASTAAIMKAGTAMPNVPALPQPLASDLPNGNGSLPLLSIIGFGILVGGVISALRTRPAHK